MTERRESDMTLPPISPLQQKRYLSRDSDSDALRPAASADDTVMTADNKAGATTTTTNINPKTDAATTTATAGAGKKRPNWFMRMVHAVGFTNLYNFILWFILAGALFGFTLARFQYLNFSVFCPSGGSRGSTGAAPGECYWYQFPRYKTGVILHLATILPASLLAVGQFTPFIRKSFRTYHRIAGYAAVALGLASIAGVLMIADRAFGGAAATQAWIGALSVAFVTALGLAVYNIRKKQIEQHRAWMIRAWVWAGSIITLRIIMIIAAQIISAYPPAQRQFLAYPCSVLRFIIRSDTALLARYPACAPLVDGTDTLGDALQVAVEANFNMGPEGNETEQLAAALHACFGMAGWLATALHVMGTEVYLKLTPKEGERLRRISYERQLEKGLKNPGNAGLTVERLGDAKPWRYEQE